MEADPFHICEAPSLGVEVLHRAIVAAANHLIRAQIEIVDLCIYAAGQEQCIVAVRYVFEVSG